MPQKATKRPKKPEVSVRDRLLDTADRLFYQEGVRAVGIDRVLAEADAAKASLYQHFGCKDQLVASYLERRTVDARATIEAYLADTPHRYQTAADRFEEYVKLDTRAPRVLYKLGFARYNSGHPAAAIEALQKSSRRTNAVLHVTC